MYYGIFLDDFDAEKFLKEYFDKHPDLDRSLFDQLMKKELEPTDGYHITLVHKNNKRDDDQIKSDPEKAQIL